ncbi:MAG TPA: helix-turn-helix domain-containing protein [Bryobacteraceae bacterium]|jgi:predicted DNA-binding transcriptional regulator AlpA|nr:helix-turn-helix domain-containing protein [Bryobacteraceae bacterium]
MQTNTSDFINLTAFAQALADRLNESLHRAASAKRIFNLDEAAEYCGFSHDSFKKKVVRDRLRKLRLDKCWRFDKADLDAWIDSHKEQIAQETAA